MLNSIVFSVLIEFAIYGPAPQQQPAPQEHKTQNNQNNSGSGVTVIVNPLADTKQDRPSQQTHDDNPQTAVERGLYRATLALAFFTAVLSILGYFQWCALRHHAEAFDGLLATMRDGLIPTKQAAEAAKTSANAVMLAERAYVKMSHEWSETNKSAAQFAIAQGQPRRGEMSFKIRITNSGNTPADVLGGGMWTRVNAGQPPTDIPPHYPYNIAPTYLTGGGTDFIRDKHCMIPIAAESAERFMGTDSLDEQLWLIGCVVYKDRFDHHHLAGYGRRYDNISKDLVFDRSTAALNYDRPLTEEEAKKYAKSEG